MKKKTPFTHPRPRRVAFTLPQVYRWPRAHHFPFAFFIRNLAYLEREDGFSAGSVRLRRFWMARMFSERVHCYREIRRLIVKKRGLMALPATDREKHPQIAPSAYCDHCGGCCEIASGLAEFPPESELPDRWRACFGDGLGPGHRFCAFMWEGKGPGMSLCAIHPWRANPCRVFEEDDCRMFKQDIDFIAFSKSRRLAVMRQRLPRLLRRTGPH